MLPIGSGRELPVAPVRVTARPAPSGTRPTSPLTASARQGLAPGRIGVPRRRIVRAAPVQHDGAEAANLPPELQGCAREPDHEDVRRFPRDRGFPLPPSRLQGGRARGIGEAAPSGLAESLTQKVGSAHGRRGEPKQPGLVLPSAGSPF